ncbi:MAG TPA: FHA domain-containing protein [Steroidobacteraceae bacterium]|nr:FHA domain-containing protein [Steroidobacteraceae bacterium]
MLALELNDAGLILARSAAGEVELVADEPGFALLEGAEIRTGPEAQRGARLRPLFAQNRYWRELGVEPLARPLGAARTPADLAFAQLERLLAPHRDAQGLLLAVPAGYTREQLGLLLGIANETGIEVRGLVDAALAACTLAPVPQRVLHLDLELHRATLAVLEHGGGDEAPLRRARFEIQPGHGWLGLAQTWIELIAETFVRKTRFDPLHEAATEQRLADELPRWLDELEESETLAVELEFGATTHRIEIERADFVAAAERHYAALVRLVQDVRPAGHAIELRIGARVARLPGLVERFGSLRDCLVTPLPRGAAAIGSLRHASLITRPPDAVALVYRLPMPGIASAAAAPGMSVAATPPERRPTHVLFGARAWHIRPEPLTLGWSVPGGQRALVLPEGIPGVSRQHCTIAQVDGAVIVEDRSTFGSWVNEERVSGRAVVEVGDKVRLGTPGVTLEMIQLVSEDGPAQD